MRIADLDFQLPPHLIAAAPAPRRDQARLLLVDRFAQSWQHRSVADLPSLVQPNDLWIFNDTRVFKARLHTADRAIEVFLLQETSPRHWLALTHPAKKTGPGVRLTFPPPQPDLPPLTAEILKTLESGERVVRFHAPFDPDAIGEMPLPPYILKARAHQSAPTPVSDEERYQTVFARATGSVAAPTAGLHFTKDMLNAIPHAFLTLHVGLGTFRPIKVDRPEDHIMHAERFHLPADTAEAAQRAARRVAVGTTTARVLESVPHLAAASGETRLFIRPPYRFRHTDALITNFHLPRSTLLMLVAAFLDPHGDTPTPRRFATGLEFLRALYAEAIAEEYRFYSYGDGMAIV